MKDLTPEMVAILRCYRNVDPDMGYGFKPLIGQTSMEVLTVQNTCRALHVKGYLKYMRGCQDEDGMVAGSVYAVTDEGYRVIKELFQYEDDMLLTVWEHKNGQKYAVVAMANTETGNQDRYPTTVVYQNIQNFKFYTRPLNDWYRSMVFKYRTVQAYAIPQNTVFH